MDKIIRSKNIEKEQSFQKLFLTLHRIKKIIDVTIAPNMAIGGNF